MPIEMKPVKTPKNVKTETPALPPPAPEAPPVSATEHGSTVSEPPAGPADTSHLDGLSVAEPEGSENHIDVPSGVSVETNGFVPMPAFTASVGMMFTLSGGLLGLKTLTEAPKQETYPAATEALYHTIVDTPSLHFLIQPGGVWMQRALAMGAFAVPLGYSVKQELAERRKNRPVESAGKRPPPTQPQPAQTAPTPPPAPPQPEMGSVVVVPGQSTKVGVLDTLSGVPG